MKMLPLGPAVIVFCALIVFDSQVSNAQIHPFGTNTHAVSKAIIETGAKTTSFAAPSLPAITGNTTVCIGTTSALSNTVSGGVWSTGNAGIATINPSTGLVTGVHGGLVVITYAAGFSSISMVITVTYPITGPTTMCVGNTASLTDTTTTGIWSSISPSVATVSVTGVVTALSAGTTNIIFGRAGACTVSQAMTITANTVADINGSGLLAVCVGSTMTATDATPSGVWTSSNPALATINSSTGVISGLTAGAVTITYSAGGCYKTKALTVNSPSSIAPITGIATVCVGNNTTLADATSLGTWSSSNTAIATVNSGGVVSGASAGTATISYIKTGCAVMLVATVNANTIAPITGGANICIGQSTTFADATAGGTWSTSNATLATIGSASGVATGMAAGSPFVTYTAGGCYKTTLVVVNPTSVVGAIGGATALCQGATTSLTDAVPGGAWSTSAPAIATINAYGLLTGVTAGTANITYTRMGCASIQNITVNPIPAAITGTKKECANGGTTTLANATGGGIWSSSNTAYATISAGGVVTGVAPGVATISYQLSTLCFITTKDTAYGQAPISGGSNACVGPFMYLYLSDATMSGTWSSSATAIATVGASTGVVTGLTAGAATITFTTAYPGLSCYVTKPITVNLAPGPISGYTSTCTGSTTTLADTTTGGAWTTANITIATVGTGGIVTGVTAGAVQISYTKNGCASVANVNVGAPPAAITGNNTVCTGLATTTLTNATTGGTWSASNTNVAISQTSATTAMITGASTGADTIYYRLGGCTASKVVTVSTNSVGSVSAASVPWACTGLTSLQTIASGAPGTWTSADTTIAKFSGSITGLSAAVLGVSQGSTVISYTKNSDGCFKTIVFSVHRQPSLITGAYSICNNATTALTDTITGGAWLSSNSSVATVSAGGVVTGVSAGPVTITYSMPGGCETYQPINVREMPVAIGGASAVCAGSTATVYDTTLSGVWTVNNGHATIATASSNSATITGVTGGTSVITYSKGGCFVTKPITIGTVNPTFTPPAVSTCAMGTPDTLITVSDGGGSWTSSNAAIATIAGATANTRARLTGISVGTVTITYTLNGCYTTQVDTVHSNTMPAITGNTEVCAGSTITLANTTTGGTWLSSNISVATIDTNSGVLTGVASGATIISYAVINGGCRQVISINVGSTPPNAIGGGATPVCAGNTTNLTETTTGGAWTSSNSTVASVNAAGVVYGVASGTASISYTLVGCPATPVVVTINALPTPITGNGVVCEHATHTLASTPGGGTWASSATANGTIDVSGVFTGLHFGTTTITYTVAGCRTTAVDSVGGDSTTLSGGGAICGTTTVNVIPSKAGGYWTSSAPSIAPVSVSGNNGQVYGNGSGTATISFTNWGGCAVATTVVTVNYIAPITGSFAVCKTDSTDLADAAGTGTWTTSDGTIATVSAERVYGINAGTATITYTVGSCNVTQSVFVNACGHKADDLTNEFQNQVFTLFPNPGNGNITITQSIAVDGAMQLTVLTYTGAKVYSGSIDFKVGKSQLNVTTAPGIYLVMLTDNMGTMQTFKVIVE